MKILINFANDKFKEKQKRNSESALKCGFDQVIEYSPEKINENFKQKYNHILSQPRGCGYWLWKPYFIYLTLKQISENDILMYTDSGSVFIDSVEPLLNLNSDIILFEQANTNGLKLFCKIDAFVKMNADSKEFYDMNYLTASFQIYKKTEKALEFAKEYLTYCCDEDILTDKENICGNNLPEFIDHRHDQSVLSILAKKWSLELYRDPSQWGNNCKDLFPNSNYNQIINQTR